MEEVKQGHSEFTSRFLLSKEEILALGVSPHAAEDYRRMHYRCAYAVSTWAPALGDRSFRTEELPLSFAEGNALLAKHYNRATEEDLATLDGLKQRIGECLASKFPNGAFLKLDTRSPKDVPFDEMEPLEEDDDSPHAKEMDPQMRRYCIELTKMVRAEVESIPKEERTPNALLIALGKANSTFMCVRDSDKAMFLLEHSSRVRQDLGKICDFPEKLFQSAVMLREWDDRVPKNQAGEFRGFVYAKKLNAVTQYITCMHFPHVVEHKQEIERRIQSYFDEVVPLIPHDNYVIDFILFDDGDIRVIELNPFYIGAGTGLFSWRENRELFMNGPFEMRVSTHIPTEEDASSFIVPMWLRFLEKVSGVCLHPRKEGEEGEESSSDSFWSWLPCTVQ